MVTKVTTTVAGLGQSFTNTVTLNEDAVDQFELSVPTETTDMQFAVGVDDITKVKALVMITDKPVTVKVQSGEEEKVVKLTNQMSLCGDAAQVLFEEGSIDSVKITNAGDSTAKVQIVIVRSADIEEED